ncbi:MAG: hypothetical protein M5R41_13975 [Bacteroidia bacterium]|nr:hypothetical protein [Bacteroidia bacterium]
MKKSALLFFSLILAFAIAGCGETDGSLYPTQQVLPQDGSGNFVLYVSNQSFDIPTVDIQVTIDGKTAVSATFEVKNQHNWIKHTFLLAPGKHVLKASSVTGEATVESEFEVNERLWGVLNYWYYARLGGNKFLEFRTQDTPMLFI